MGKKLKVVSGEESLYNLDADVEIPEGLGHLVNWYSDYAKEVVTDRAIINIDGFKPVHRRILYAMKKHGVKDLTKSAKVVGYALGYHPHGDASIYESLVRMTDRAEYMNIPFVVGKGSFGKVFNTSSPAAMRYTETTLSNFSDLVFEGMDGIRMIHTEDGGEVEPELLPVAVPNLLMNATQGIAVGMASNIPSFNYHEIIQATIELAETGDIKKPLAPDFTTRGSYVYDEAELNKILTTGRGRLKLRGKWTVDGKTIIIEEIPYYTTVQAIMNQIAKKQIPDVVNVRNESDRRGLSIAVECNNKKNVDSVLTALLRDTDLQMSMTTNLTVIVKDHPKVLGIKDLLNEWLKFREEIVAKSLKSEYEGVLLTIPRYELLVDLLSHTEKRDGFVERLTKQNSSKARMFLRELYPGTDEDVFDWILRMTLNSLSGVASKESKLAQLYARKAQLEEDLANVRKVIVRRLKELNTAYSFPRRTEITDVDYTFEKETQTVVKVDPVPVVVKIEGKFIKKLRLNVVTETVEGIRCMSDDVISFIDNQGRLLRVNLENIEFVHERDRGVYLPVYLETEDNFEIMAYDVIQDKKVGYVYSDGFASVVDYGEWVDSKRTTRMTEKGVSPLSWMIVGEIDLSKPYILLITKERKFGFAESNFKHKHRSARTKLVGVKGNDRIEIVVSVTLQDMMKLVNSPMKYVGKLGNLDRGDSFDSEYFESLTQ